jgi:hypothetical protein
MSLELSGHCDTNQTYVLSNGSSMPFSKEIEMSAITVFVPPAYAVELPRSRPTSAQPRTVINMVPATAQAKSSGNGATGDWRLTDRGIAVIMVIAAMILIAGMTVIGITAVRVTSPSGDPGFQESGQVQH